MRSTARSSTTSSGSRRPRSWPPPTGTPRPRVRSASPTSTSRPAWPTRSRSCTMPRARSPVLLTAGQQDTRLLVHEPILAGDLVKMAEPFTKWAYEIRGADEAVSVLGRAVTIALTPPTGPVFLSLPMDLMTDETDAPAPRTQGPSAQRPGVPGIQLADDSRQIGRSYPVDLAFAAAITPTLRLIADELAERLSDAQRAAAADRRAQLERVRVDFVARTRAAAEAEAERAPISPAHLMHTLAGLLPDDVVIVDESASSLPHVLRHLPFRR